MTEGRRDGSGGGIDGVGRGRERAEGACLESVSASSNLFPRRRSGVLTRRGLSHVWRGQSGFTYKIDFGTPRRAGASKQR